MLDIALVVIVIVTGAILLWPRVSKAPLWRATITPLASIIGSGFLVLGPILDNSYGHLAPLVMAALCLVAYLFGFAVRYNIAVIDEGEDKRGPMEQRLDTLSSWVLAFAYVISVSYYLNLFGAFGVSLTPVDGKIAARILTTAVFVAILGVGWFYGFKAMERMEQISVGIKLAIIAALLAGLGWYFFGHVSAGTLIFNPPTLSGLHAITLGFGLIVTVQGFETSRYLGNTYDARTRIRSMRLSQWLSTAIYMVYIVFLSYVFAKGDFALTETAIIDMMQVVAPILPALLVLAALSAQFSAAVADTSGSGGLIAEQTAGRVPEPAAYALLVVIGILLTWTLDVFEIISYASRAFALYYAIQAAVAATAANRKGHRKLSIALLALAIFGALIFLFGEPAE
ncbi:hypothetical protein [Rhizobium halophytocola]|uniref:Amino acid permease n=1 Tax=Rhizobium halophytocola TaxID=735519 RepID=A0ABS4E5J6_9HYPH|nr:hypothetical protein [Rhizobium halophytocola]MBP1853174.1 hypothetical protein [Rhizobium halophytocola]